MGRAKVMIPISGIYKIYNTINGNCYIGSSCNIDVRIKDHFGKLRKNKHPATHMQSAFNKYGEENFCYSILLICERKELLFYEQKLIDINKPVYNYCNKATGHPLTEETKEKLRKKSLGRHWSDKMKLQISNKLKGRSTGPKSDETKRKLSQSLMGHYVSEETKKKVSETKKIHIYKHSEQSKEKIKQASLDMWRRRKGEQTI